MYVNQLAITNSHECKMGGGGEVAHQTRRMVGGSRSFFLTSHTHKHTKKLVHNNLANVS